jgi:hypothetical protein
MGYFRTAILLAALTLSEMARQMGQSEEAEDFAQMARTSGPWSSPQASGLRRRGPWDAS